MPSPKRRNHDVANLVTFKDTNKYAVNSPDYRLYVVYSYRDSWPMFIYDRHTGQWMENEDRYSVTTSKHRTQCHPHCATEKVSRAFMLGYIERMALEDVPL